MVGSISTVDEFVALSADIDFEHPLNTLDRVAQITRDPIETAFGGIAGRRSR